MHWCPECGALLTFHVNLISFLVSLCPNNMCPCAVMCVLRLYSETLPELQAIQTSPVSTGLILQGHNLILRLGNSDYLGYFTSLILL